MHYLSRLNNFNKICLFPCKKTIFNRLENNNLSIACTTRWLFNWEKITHSISSLTRIHRSIYYDLSVIQHKLYHFIRIASHLKYSKRILLTLFNVEIFRIPLKPENWFIISLFKINFLKIIIDTIKLSSMCYTPG